MLLEASSSSVTVALLVVVATPFRSSDSPTSRLVTSPILGSKNSVLTRSSEVVGGAMRAGAHALIATKNGISSSKATFFMGNPKTFCRSRAIWLIYEIESLVYLTISLNSKAKENKSPAAVTERQRTLAITLMHDLAPGFYRLNPTGFGSLRPETDSGSGVFEVRAQIPRAFGPPFGCCASLRSEIAI